MSEIEYRLNDDSYYTIEKSPIVLSGPLASVNEEFVDRVTIFKGDEKLLHWDIYLTDDTRYEANLEVSPKFRFSGWMEILLESEPGSLEIFSRPNCVWVNSGPIIIEQEQALVDFHKEMTARNIMRTERIYAHGLLNKVIEL